MAQWRGPAGADGRPARAPPFMEPVCHGAGAVASPTGARTARRRHRPRREGVLLASSEWGINGGRTAEVLQRLRVLLPTPRRAGRARAGQNGAPRGAQAVPGGEALSTKMGDAHAEHAPEGLVSPAVWWGTLGAHAVAAQRESSVGYSFIGARSARAVGRSGAGVREVCKFA